MNASINAVSPLVNILRKIFYAYFIRLWKINCFLECPVEFFNKFKPSFLFPQSAKTVHQRKLIFIKVLKVTGKRYVTAANQRDHPEFRGSRRSLLTIPGAREKSSYPVLKIALTLCRVNLGLALWGRKVRDEN
ncbi:uncharacterized protein [Cardiocondyla obscurior]|uniref:uncharacterized protein n=1 Tax=Cardiocondyla obscurior TaxID=286306 RepID=UPI00396564BD